MRRLFLLGFATAPWLIAALFAVAARHTDDAWIAVVICTGGAVASAYHLGWTDRDDL